MAINGDELSARVIVTSFGKGYLVASVEIAGLRTFDRWVTEFEKQPRVKMELDGITRAIDLQGIAQVAQEIRRDCQ
jgi:hypothetical protein